MRVVFDTNVLISALIFRKHLEKIETMIIHGDSTPCFIPATFQEFQNVLEYSKLHPFMQASNVTPKQIIVAVTKKSLFFADPIRIPQAVTDTSDNYILAAATTSRAEYIVTGDKLLLSLKEFVGIPIVTPRTFLAKI